MVNLENPENAETPFFRVNMREGAVYRQSLADQNPLEKINSGGFFK